MHLVRYLSLKYTYTVTIVNLISKISPIMNLLVAEFSSLITMRAVLILTIAVVCVFTTANVQTSSDDGGAFAGKVVAEWLKPDAIMKFVE